MRPVLFTVALALSAVPMARAAAQAAYGPSPAAATQQEILRLRERAWRTWFSNDTAGFKAVVPAELLAIGWDGGPWQDRAETIKGMADFAKSGLKLDELHFVKNAWQQYGDVIILYSNFHVALRGPKGEKQETYGRGTEVFVKRNGRWIHTGWHLDNVKFS
ncbi:MAG: nuclear transport factor 2 family protein [Gemmatimonadaceae bacterium]|nr:nuclear transport factor 2 family protein [Gemmatimonadaceae bacterium]